MLHLQIRGKNVLLVEVEWVVFWNLTEVKHDFVTKSDFLMRVYMSVVTLDVREFY